MPNPNPRPSAADRIRAAQWFSERGFGVFPCWSTHADGACRCPQGKACTSPGKHPITKDGFKSHTMDPARIQTFLSAPSEPNYGLVAPEGVFILDVDGEGWQDKLHALESEHGPLPPTLRDDTANGQHIFLRWPDGYPRPLKQLFGWVTRWGSGPHSGYVIGPRSVHASGAEYRPSDGAVADIATLPDAWAAAGVTRTGISVKPADGSRTFDQVAAGGRHDFLRDRARTLRGGGLAGEALFAAVMDLNERYCAPPKSAEEVERAIGDVEAKFEPDPLLGTDGAHDERTDTMLLGSARFGEFPEPPNELAYGGLCGEIVAEMALHTDASREGLLASFLALSGAVFPVHGYSFGDQTSSPFVALVGESSTGRKGTAMNRALDTLRLAIGAAEVNALLLDGLNSGEGLITALANRKQYARDLCAIIFEDEFASLLQSRGRDGSTLDPKMRAAFDGGVLSNRKAAGEQSVHPRYWLPALTAITPDELRRRLEPGSYQSGSANRWLYVPVQRRDVLIDDAPPILPVELTAALTKARQGGERQVSFEAAATLRLSEYAAFVVSESAGVSRDLVKRYQTIAARLAMVHAALERDSIVRLEHLDRAMALTEYARRGFLWVFGQTVGNPLADLILRFLQVEGSLSANYITRHIERGAIRRQEAIDELLRLGYVQVVVAPTKGRPRSDLRLDPSRRPFVPFNHVSAMTRDVKTGETWTKGLHSPSTGLDESRTKVGQKLDESGTEVDGSRDSDGSDTSETDRIVDHSTGEVMDATGEWAKPCRDYQAHQDSHRNRPEGWVCIACWPEEETT